MGNKQAGNASFLPESQQFLHDFCLHRYIEHRRRFIQDKDFRVEEQEPGKTDPLQLPAGQFRRMPGNLV